jgi:hypothetical protein
LALLASLRFNCLLAAAVSRFPAAADPSAAAATTVRNRIARNLPPQTIVNSANHLRPSAIPALLQMPQSPQITMSFSGNRQLLFTFIIFTLQHISTGN